MIIKIPQNTINNIVYYWKRDNNGREISDLDCFKIIFKLLKYDELININFEQIDWEIIKDKFQGSFLPEINKVVFFAQKLTPDGKTGSRNTYISQNFVHVRKFAEKNNLSISISINPLDLGKKPKLAEFIIQTLKGLMTEGVYINSSMPFGGQPFVNLQDFVNVRAKLRSKKTGNLSTILIIEPKYKNIIVYGKLGGANGCDTLNICKVIKKLSVSENYICNFFDVTNDSNVNDQRTLDEIKLIGFIINDVNEYEKETIDLLGSRTLTDKQFEDMLQRDQMAFKANIIKRYIDVPNFDIHKCFACEYNVESNLIGSHIYRYADIKRDHSNGLITTEQAAHLIISGDNGFLLCGTQDKEFEKGQIYFDIDKKNFVADKNKLTNDEYKLVNNKIKANDFNNVNFSDEFIKNIKQHLSRVNPN